MKCDKCQSSLEGGGSIHSWGETYNFCRLCFSLVEQDKSPAAPERFLDGEGLSSADKSIIEARKKRSRGDSPWSTPEI